MSVESTEGSLELCNNNSVPERENSTHSKVSIIVISFILKL